MERRISSTWSKAGRAAAYAVALVLASCTASASTVDQADFAIRDVAVVIRSEEPFTRAPDFPARVESTLDAALEYWGGTWNDLAGRSITFEGDQTVTCGTHTGAFGCFDGNIRLSTRDSGLPLLLRRQTVLVHEVGHAVIGDVGHEDPRWMDFGAVMAKLDGRRGYTARTARAAASSTSPCGSTRPTSADRLPGSIVRVEQVEVVVREPLVGRPALRPTPASPGARAARPGTRRSLPRA